MNRIRSFKRGAADGFPICLGYLSVSFGIGLLAMKAGMTVVQAVILSLTNLTSAGQAAGIGIIAAGGTLLETALTQFVINLRYALMGLSLSQKLDKSFGTPQRLLVSYGITDEVFGVSSAFEGKLRPEYMYGMILVATAGWVGGTLLGALAGEALPASVTNALGIMLYGMFIAIIVPPARHDRNVLYAIMASIVLSGLCAVMPLLSQMTPGFRIILLTVVIYIVLLMFDKINSSSL